MYGMTNSGKLFADQLTEWLLEAGFIRSQFQMSVEYNYAPYGTKNVVLSYIDDFVYWYTPEALGEKNWQYRKEIPFKLPGMCTLVRVNQDFPDERPFHFSI